MLSNLFIPILLQFPSLVRALPQHQNGTSSKSSGIGAAWRCGVRGSSGGLALNQPSQLTGMWSIFKLIPCWPLSQSVPILEKRFLFWPWASLYSPTTAARTSTRLNSTQNMISYAAVCFKNHKKQRWDGST